MNPGETFLCEKFTLQFDLGPFTTIGLPVDFHFNP